MHLSGAIRMHQDGSMLAIELVHFWPLTVTAPVSDEPRKHSGFPISGHGFCYIDQALKPPVNSVPTLWTVWRQRQIPL